MWEQTNVCLGSVQEDFFGSGMPEGLSKCVNLAGNSTLDLSSCILEYKRESAKRAVMESEVNRKGNKLKGYTVG